VKKIVGKWRQAGFNQQTASLTEGLHAALGLTSISYIIIISGGSSNH
jgi:hypothetical protein